MDAGGPTPSLEAAWIDRALKLNQHERVLVPPHAITFIRVHGFRDLRLYACLSQQGFSRLGKLDGVAEKTSLGRERAPRLRIEDFFIREDLRGCGIGSQMLAVFLRLAAREGFRHVVGELSSQDAIDGSVSHLIRFYERHGFEVSTATGKPDILATIRYDVAPSRRTCPQGLDCKGR